MNNFIEIIATKRSISCRTKLNGIGINDAWYMVNEKKINSRSKSGCPYYIRWARMMERCYSEKYHERFPTYKNCTVCEEWLIFSNFRKWMELQNWQGKELDKDIIKPFNKHYCPELCHFIPNNLNSFLNDCGVNGKNNRRGVFNLKKSGYFVRCRVNGDEKRFSPFESKDDASKFYRKLKSDLLLVFLSSETDERLRNGIIEISKLIKKGDY